MAACSAHLRLVANGLAVEGVQQRVARAVGRASAAVRLPALTVLKTLPTERTLVDLALLGPGEGHAIVLQLDHGARCFLAHVMDGILVAKPITSLDSIVHVPPPVVLRHVPQRGIDTALRSYSVRARREELRDTRGIEAMLGETKGGAQSRAACTHNYRVVLVIHNVVSRLGGLPAAAGL